MIYQLHVGDFLYAEPAEEGAARSWTWRAKIPHLAELGVTAIQLLPIQEFQTSFSLGYNGTDYFSPEMDFAVDGRGPGPLCREPSIRCWRPSG